MNVRRISIGVMLTALLSVGLVRFWPKAPLARVTLREGTVERDRRGRERDFHTAALSDALELGDALRTGSASRAHLLLSRGAALAVAESTVVRLLSDAPHAERFRVEEGSLEIETGDAELSFATAKGRVRVARDTRVSVRDDSGQTWVRVDMGRAELGWDPAQPLLAGDERTSPKEATALTSTSEPSAAAASPVPPLPQDPRPTDGVAAVVRGQDVQIQLAGAHDLAPIAQGEHRLPLGTRVAVEDGSSVELAQRDGGKLVTKGRTELLVGDGLTAQTRVLSGRVHATGGEVPLEIMVPGGRIVLLVDPAGATQGALQVARSDTEVQVESGVIALHDVEGEQTLTAGARGHLRSFGRTEAKPSPNEQPAELAATVSEKENEAEGEPVAPDYEVPELADLALPITSSVEIHDPTPPTAIRFAVDKLCRGREAVLEQKTRRGYAARGAGENQLLAFFAVGSTSYRVRCRRAHGALGDVVAQGRVRVRRDRAERRVTQKAPEFEVDLDGRKYTAVYQTGLPRVHVRAPAGREGKLRVSSPKGTKTFALPAAGLTLASGELGEGEYILQLATKSSTPIKDTTLTIRFDNATPAASVEGADGLRPESGGRYTLRGVALPGSEVFVNDMRVRLDREGRFETKLLLAEGARGFGLFIKNPRAGSHYYVRRASPRGKAP